MTWRKIIQYRRKYERLYKAKIYRSLMDQLNDLLKEINPWVLDILPEKINTVVSNNSLKTTLTMLYKDVGWTFFKEAKFIKSAEDIQRSLWDELMQKIILEETGRRIVDITNYSKDILIDTAREALRIGQEQGLGIMELERFLRESLTTDFRAMSRMRALRIVQTEVMSASNFATLKAGEMSGIQMRKVWLTAPFGVARTERHNLYPGLSEQRPAKGQPFILGDYRMQYPGDASGGAENVINCRCAMSWEPVEDTI